MMKKDFKCVPDHIAISYALFIHQPNKYSNMVCWLLTLCHPVLVPVVYTGFDHASLSVKTVSFFFLFTSDMCYLFINYTHILTCYLHCLRADNKIWDKNRYKCQYWHFLPYMAQWISVHTHCGVALHFEDHWLKGRVLDNGQLFHVRLWSSSVKSINHI